MGVLVNRWWPRLQVVVSQCLDFLGDPPPCMPGNQLAVFFLGALLALLSPAWLLVRVKSTGVIVLPNSGCACSLSCFVQVFCVIPAVVFGRGEQTLEGIPPIE